MPNFRMFENYQPGTAGGACYLCHAAPRDGELVVDTGTEISFEGLLGICSVCVSRMAALYGFVDAGAAAQAIHEADEAKAAAARAEDTAAKAAALADALSGYNEYRREQDKADAAAAKRAEEEASQREAEAAAAAAAKGAEEEDATPPAPPPAPEPDKKPAPRKPAAKTAEKPTTPTRRRSR